ncbi:immunoglobulin superfamily member 1-like [Mauremys reevesii]|uniref:immunoglobulin superfamily member 1-like n=1 Tax=Mauremys reevesii TaxID=260615 RepID=UPI00193F4F9C|nr:immunoglobulin superfamily member 1-like [Mauremys reevesii]
MDPMGDVAEFPIRSMSQRDAGSYSCQYSTKWDPPIWSEPSDPVELVVSELKYPKPSISLRPSGGVALGGAVTVWCRGRHQNARFLLYKDGNLTTLQDMETTGNLAEFPIRNVSQRDAGSYSCYYYQKWYTFILSHPSDPVELVVAEPKPNITLHPSRQVILGGAVTIQCECRCPGARVLVHKAGVPDAWRAMDSTGDVAEFPIRNVSWGDTGSYSCRYRTKWDPPVWSEPSDPVELVVAEGTDPAGPQQTDPPPTEPEGEGGTNSTQLGTALATTHPGSAGPGASEPSPAPGLTRNIITGGSAAAAGLLLLLLLLPFLCYRRTRGKKGRAPRQSR